MTCSFVDWPEINISWCSSTSSYYNEPGNIYLFNFYWAVCNMLSFLVSSKSCALQANVFILLLLVVVKRYICCAFRSTSMRWSGSTIGFVSEVKTFSPMWCVFMCELGGEVSVRARSAVKPSPSACWEEEAWWQRKTWSFCRARQQTRPTDIGKDGLSLAMHVMRRRRDS